MLFLDLIKHSLSQPLEKKTEDTEVKKEKEGKGEEEVEEEKEQCFSARDQNISPQDADVERLFGRGKKLRRTQTTLNMDAADRSGSLNCRRM